MDSQDYSNILKAINRPSDQYGGLSPSQQSENYNAFSELMRKGVSLPDLIRKAEDADRKENEERAKAERELLLVMEQTVKDDQDVKDARKRVSDVKTALITEMCMRDPRYKDAVEAYEQTVRSAYVRSREGERPS